MWYKCTVQSFPIVFVWGNDKKKESVHVPYTTINFFSWMFSICSWIPVCKAHGYGRQAVSPHMDACIIVVLISSWVSASMCPLGLMYLLCILQMRKVMPKEKWFAEGHTTSEGQNQSLNSVRSDGCQSPESPFSCSVMSLVILGMGGLGKNWQVWDMCHLLLTTLYNSWKVRGQL